MSLKSDILSQLQANEGEFISGQTLASRRGVTRAAVWKAVVALKNEGYNIVGTTKAGYRLLPSDVLSEEQLLNDLAALGLDDVSVYLFDSVASTNLSAAEISAKLLAENNAENSEAENTAPRRPILIIAQRQTGGKARKGGKFPSEAGGLYMSLVLFPNAPAELLNEFSGKIYAAVNKVLKGDRSENVIFYEGKKVCGILTECTADPDSIKSCIAGIGVYPLLLRQEVQETYPARSKLCAAICKEIFADLLL